MKRLFINTLILTISISCFGMTPDRNNDKTVKRTVVTTKTTTSKNTHFGRKPTTTVTKTVVTRPGNTVGCETCCKNNKKSCTICNKCKKCSKKYTRHDHKYNKKGVCKKCGLTRSEIRRIETHRTYRG